MSEMADAIRALAQEKNISIDSVKMTVESTIKAAYKKAFTNADNCIVKFEDDMSDVIVYSRKVVVDGVYDPSHEIELEEALKLSSEVEIGDEIDIRIDPKDLSRVAVSTGKQTAHMSFSETSKSNLYNEYKPKIGQTIIGYYQREYNGNIFLDLGKVEGVLPQKYQSPREVYEKNERIKAVIVEIKKTNSGIQLILSRTDEKLVRNILEQEVPDIADNVVVIKKIVREAGYRTKVAVYANDPNIDPVGACVGQKGARINNVIQELEGERIDVLKYDSDPRTFIKNSLSPANVNRVVILDADKREALAIVNDDEYSVAIGKQGQNVRLANKLCDWVIDVKTESQAAEMDLTDTEVNRQAEELFNNNASQEYDEINTIGQLPGVDPRIVEVLVEQNLDDIVAFIGAYEDQSIFEVPGITDEEIEKIYKIINENVEFEEEDVPESNETEEVEEEYECPECGAKITLDMTHCPNCGCEFAFEEE